jgi:hypothetical protein
MKKTLSWILVFLIALVIGTFVFRIFAWFMWNLFLPLVFGLIVIFIVVHLASRKRKND